MLHGVGRRRGARRVRHPGDARRGSVGADGRGSRRRGARRPRGALRGDRRLAVRVLHAGDPRAPGGRRGEGQDPAGRSRSRPRRAPVPLHRLAVGLRGRRRTRSRRHRRATPRRRPVGRSSKAARRSSWAPSCPWATGASPTTAPRDALVAVPLPPGSTATAVEAAGMSWVVAEIAPRGARARGQGAGPTHDGRSGTAARAACTGDRRRTAQHVVGRTGVPGARRIVVRAGRRPGVAARQRRRVRREGRIAGGRRGA